MLTKCAFIVGFTFLLYPLIASAQGVSGVEVSAGPTFSLTGIGLGTTAKITPMFSASAEFNTVPFVPEIDLGDIEDIDYTEDLSIWSFTLMGHYHPTGGAFAMGAGVYFGGYGLMGTGIPSVIIEIGDETYSGSQLGVAEADFRLGGPAPVIEIGRRGRGFNIGIGAVIPINSKVELTFSSNTLPPSEQAELESSIEAELADIEDVLKVIPALPFFRIGYQIGF